jgi:hypothetical protein
LGDGERGSAVDTDEEKELALGRLHFCGIDVKEAYRVALERQPPGLVSRTIRQAREAFAIGLEPMAG